MLPHSGVVVGAAAGGVCIHMHDMSVTDRQTDGVKLKLHGTVFHVASS